MIGRPWRLAHAGRRFGEQACGRGVIEGFGRLDKTTSAPDGHTPERGLADRGRRDPASVGANLDGSRQARSVPRWETIVMPGHRCASRRS
jgi:hypothetical protein